MLIILYICSVVDDGKKVCAGYRQGYGSYVVQTFLFTSML